MTDDPHGLPATLDASHPLFGLGYAQPVERRSFLRVTDGGVEEASATVAEETPVALVYNGWPHVVMMCTPADVEDFAYGFTVTEEIVRFEEIERVAAVRSSQGIEVELVIPQDRADALRGRGRSLVGRTGCGLCGVTTIGDALRAESHVAPGARYSRDAIFRAGESCRGFNTTTKAPAPCMRRDGRRRTETSCSRARTSAATTRSTS